MSRGRGAGGGRGRGAGRAANIPAGISFEDVMSANMTRDPTPLYPVSLRFPRSELPHDEHSKAVSRY